MKTMKRVKITEEQYSGFLKQFTKAFQLGADYESTSMLDMEGRKEILQKLNQLQAKIDSVN